MTTKEDGMSNELERVARALNITGWTCGGGAHEPGNYDTCPECKGACDEGARAAIAALTRPSQTLRRALGVLHVVEGDHYGRYCKSCSTNDRRVSDPCPTHRVLREFDMGNLPELPDSSTLNVIAEVRAVAKQYADASASLGGAINAGMLEILALIDREATQ